MPRWTTRTSLSSKPTSRYLPARRTDRTLRPSIRPRNSAAVLWRRMERLPLASTVLTRRPTISFSRSRRMVSTSGSSGTASRLPHGALLGHAGHTVGSGVGVGVERLPRRARRGLLGVLLRPPLARPGGGAPDEDPRRIAAGVVGARAVDLVAGQLPGPADHELLQPRLEILGSRPGGGFGDTRIEPAQDEA